VDPVSIASLALSTLTAACAGFALFLALRSTPTRVLGELDALIARCDATSRVAQAATADVASMADQWNRHRVEVGKLLDSAIDAMDQAERKRRSARTERRRAEEVHEGEAQAQAPPAAFMCPGCEYEHLGNENCVQAAKRRFTAQGLAV
jgi:TolA-binding protein